MNGSTRAVSDTMDGTWICDGCGGETRRPPVPIKYAVLDEIHDGDVVTCEECEEAAADANECLFRLHGCG